MKKFLSVTNAAVSAFAAIAVNTFLRPCHGMMLMKCNYTTNIGTMILILITIISIISAIVKNVKAGRILNGLSIIASAAVIFVPLFGSCGSAMMSCNRATMPAFRIVGSVLLLISVIGFAVSFLRTRQVKTV